MQSEKILALGLLVAGVAHEINNPVNFIYGNLTHADDSTEDLMRVIETYQQQYSQADSELEELLEEVDLDYLPSLIIPNPVGKSKFLLLARFSLSLMCMGDSPEGTISDF
jgi:signal transduction histidine kinase